MIWDFSAWLLLGTFICGVIWGIDSYYFKRKREGRKEPILVEYARSFFPIFLIVFLLRAFLVEPYRIPSGSMKPTLLDGDFILVNKFVYGIRLPLTDTLVVANKPVARGDVIVFRYPSNPNINYIKRVVGLPGDTIVYRDKQLFINGEWVPKLFEGFVTITDPNIEKNYQMKRFQEDLGKIKHDIYENTRRGADFSLVVPDENYFVMGDNRDESDDSRFFGFVPADHVLGEAFAVWLSWDPENYGLRFSRMFHMIQ